MIKKAKICHGYNGYSNLGCRCIECTEANRVHHLNYIHRHPEQLEHNRNREAIRRLKQGMKPRLPHKTGTFILTDGTILRLIDLTQGRWTLIEEIDYPTIKNLSFYCYNNYAKCKIAGKLYPLHQLIGGKGWDHINRNKLDNRRSNIREATHQQQIWNVGIKNVPKTSQYKGVSWQQGKWRSEIRNNGKLIFLGTYSDEIDAALAFDVAVELYRDDIAYRNFPK